MATDYRSGKNAINANDVILSDKLIKAAGSHTLCERRDGLQLFSPPVIKERHSVASHVSEVL